MTLGPSIDILNFADDIVWVSVSTNASIRMCAV